MELFMKVFIRPVRYMFFNMIVNHVYIIMVLGLVTTFSLPILFFSNIDSSVVWLLLRNTYLILYGIFFTYTLLDYLICIKNGVVFNVRVDVLGLKYSIDDNYYEVNDIAELDGYKRKVINIGNLTV